MREVSEVETVLTQLTIEYDSLKEFHDDLSERRAAGFSPVGKCWTENGKRFMKYTKLVDNKL